MSQTIPLLSVPRQSLTVLLNEDDYQLSLLAVNEIMVIDIVRNDEEILRGHRLVAGTPLIPYRYLEDGNFLFLTGNNSSDLPFYTHFGVTQNLLYLTPEEMAAARL